jgi:hypothetical protein
LFLLEKLLKSRLSDGAALLEGHDDGHLIVERQSERTTVIEVDDEGVVLVEGPKEDEHDENHSCLLTPFPYLNVS